MITFPCRCHHVFEVTDEMAGLQVQCPACNLLVDVPTHDEQLAMAEDGTFLVEEAPPPTDSWQFEEMRRAFAREKVDEYGREIDLRTTPDQLQNVGTEAPTQEEQIFNIAPKYDPETGELLRPIDVRPDPKFAPHPSNIPMAQTTLQYASANLNPKVSFLKPLVELLTPINIAAMFFVLAAHVFLTVMNLTILSFCAIFLFFIIAPGLIAHYANVIEEIGVEERDELPRFLRYFNVYEDIFAPFFKVMLSVFLCYGPGMIFYAVAPIREPTRELVADGLFLVGTAFFPAVVLTAITSGVLVNLRPDRVIETIIEIGPKYALFVVLFFVAINVYWAGIAATLSVFVSIFSMTAPKNAGARWAIAYGLLCSGIYLMHYFAWVMGLTYRAHHEKFPWVLQRWVREIPGVNAPRRPAPPRARPTGFPVDPPVARRANLEDL
jgi:hypothetical protein